MTDTHENFESSPDAISVKLEAFEGPLDLLLYLIRKNELNIYDIPIALITERYLGFIELMQELNLDVAGEFLVMASTLIHIKSKMLLPRDPSAPADADELEDPRQELVDRLLEHQRYKAVAEMLYTRGEMERVVFTRPESEEEKVNAEVSASVFDLLTAFRDVILRAEAIVELEIARDEVTLGEKIAELRVLVGARDTLSVRELFERSRSRRELVITFLAILELVKTREIRIAQSDTFGEIGVRRREPEPDDPEFEVHEFSEDDYR